MCVWHSLNPFSRLQATGVQQFSGKKINAPVRFHDAQPPFIMMAWSFHFPSIVVVRSESEWNDWILIDRIDYIFIQVQRAWCPFGLAPSSWPFRDSPFEKGNRLINLINYYINWSLIYFFITLPLDQFSSSCDLVINRITPWKPYRKNQEMWYNI